MNRQILVVEDEPDFAQMVCLRLSLNGYQCDLVQSTDSAVRALVNSRYGLVILDLMIPGGGGLKVLEYRKRHQLCETPVIVVTGQSLTPQLRNRLRELDISALFSKPYDSAEFIRLVHSCVQKSESIGV